MGYPSYPEHPTRTVQRIYVASSWRNPYQQAVVYKLRAEGFEVYDFKNPSPGNHGFHWSDIDPEWKGWQAESFRDSLSHPIAAAGFKSDFDAMQWADTGVLLLPSGRSAHLEAGWFTGTGRRLYILLDVEQEPELMYKMATGVCLTTGELIEKLRSHR